MHRKTLPLLVLALFLLAAPLARARTGSSHGCTPSAGRVLLSNGIAQVYGAKNRLSEPLIFGCVLGRKHISVLGSPPECTGSGCIGLQGQPVLAGQMVAYELFSSSRPCCRSTTIQVRDLRSGRTIHRLPTGAPSREGDVGGGSASAIVLKSDGAVAWILSGGPARGNEVHVADEQGSRVLASGTDIDEHSLALAGSTLYWTQGGKPFSATLH
jgi:hypothetical protein